MTYKVESLDSFFIEGRGTAYVIRSPVTAKRNRKDILEAIGNEIIIDGITCVPIDFETYALGTPLRIGEPIVVLTWSP
jgi:hypothetical protein